MELIANRLISLRIVLSLDERPDKCVHSLDI